MYFVYSSSQNMFEIEYIENLLLSKVDNLSKVTLENFDMKNKEPIILYYSDADKQISQEIKTFIEKYNRGFFLIHISDEVLNADYEIYKKAYYIFRGYYSPSIRYKNCFTIPIGFQSGFLNNSLQKENKFIWSFIGQTYSDRKIMIESLNELKPFKTFNIDSFMDKNSLSVSEQQEIYKKTLFAPCPFGFANPDTFRIMEVLESGCIPIVKKFYFIDYYKFVFGDHPFLIVDEWSQAPGLIRKYLKDENLLNEKIDEINTWYKSFKLNLSNDVNNVIQNVNSNFLSEQKSYQDSGRNSVLVFLSFFYYFGLRKKSYFIKMNKAIYKFKEKIKEKIK